MAYQALPKCVHPTHYDLQIEPDFETNTFRGTVTIALEVTETLVSLKLHTHDLTILSTTLTDASSNPIQISATKIDREAQTFKTLLEHHVPPNTKLVLCQTFTGILRRDGLGLHMPADGTRMASTNMEPISARSVFPCFDEPSFKATFSIILLIPPSFTGISNMPAKSTMTLLSGTSSKMRIEFQESHIMSTYLVAFAIGEFDCINTTDYRVPIRAFVPHGYNVEHCRYALEITGRSLQILEGEDMLDMPYALPKLDLVLVPGSSGGMENWGLITLSIPCMLIAADNSAADKITLMQLVCHEVAHQWFGNLVSTMSWDNVWLKEGLAEWATLKVQNRMQMSLDPYLEFVSIDFQLALLDDSKRFGHPLEVTIDGNVITKPFYDAITYKKGCAVLQMLASYVGSDIFLNGLKLYLRLHEYNNTITEDLWSAMSQVSGIDIGALLTPWTTTSGFPTLTIEEDHGGGSVHVVQSPCSMLGLPEDGDRLWPIPLHTPGPEAQTLRVIPTKSKLMDVCKSINLNEKQTGFYRVAHNTRQITMLCEDIGKGRLCVEDRIGIISNMTALVTSGQAKVRISDLLSLLQIFEDEENFFVWKIIISVLNDIRKSLMYEKNQLRGEFDRFCKHLVRRCLYRKGQFSLNDDLNEQRFKAMMFENSYGDEKVYEAAQMMFGRFVAGDATLLNPNLRAGVFRIVLSRGGRDEYHKLTQRLKTASLAERNDILCSLGYSTHPKSIKQTIKLASTPELISKSEFCKTLQPLATHPGGLAALWKFSTSGTWMQNPHLSQLKVAPLGGYIFAAYTTREQSENAKRFLDGFDAKDCGGNVEQAYDDIEVKARWLDRDRDELKMWLERNGYGYGSSGSVGFYDGVAGRLEGSLKGKAR